MSDGQPGDELARGGSEETGEMDQGRDDTFFLPKEALDGQPVQSGDILKFKVVGTDSEGGVEVECVHDDAKGGKSSGKSWQDDLRASVPEGGSTPESY